MIIERAYKTELDPTEEQRRILVRHVAGARVAHNWVLEKWIELDTVRAVVLGLRAAIGLDVKGGEAACVLGYTLRLLCFGTAIPVRTPKGEPQRYRYEYVAGTVIPDFRASQVDWYAQLVVRRSEEPERFGWFEELSSFAIREAVLDVEDGWKHFFEHIKTGRYDRAGRPRFRSRKHASYHADQPHPIRITDRAVKIPGVGWVRLKERGYLPSTEEKSHRFPSGGKAIGLGLSEVDGRWYVALRCSVPTMPAQGRGPGRALRERSTPRIPGRRVGVENGVRVLAVAYDGESSDVVVEDGLRDDSRIGKLVVLRKRWERRMARRAKLGVRADEQSAGWREAANRVRHYHARIVQLRDDRVGKVVRKIIDRGAETVLVREPHVAELLSRKTAPDAGTRNRLAPDVHGARMGDLRERLEYKQKWAGGTVVLVDKFEPVTKRCSECGAVRETNPSYPNFKCSSCGHVEDRDDANAPKNLHNYSGGNSGEAGPRSADLKPSSKEEDNARRKRTARAKSVSSEPRPRTASGTGLVPEPPPQVGHAHLITRSNPKEIEHRSDAQSGSSQFREDTADQSRRSRDLSQNALQVRELSTPLQDGPESLL